MLQAATLLRAGSPMAGAFCRSRLGNGRGLAMGTLTGETALQSFIERILADGRSRGG